MLIYPLFMIIKLAKLNTLLNHTHPRIERNCKLSFIRENMLLATVLDSFSITNFETFCRKPIPFNKLMYSMTFFLQDLPQMTMHLYFLIGMPTSSVPHSESTVELSLVISILAICASCFNFISSKPVLFDPILLLIELKRRAERNAFPRRKRFSKLLHKDQTIIDKGGLPIIAKRRATVAVFKAKNNQINPFIMFTQQE